MQSPTTTEDEETRNTFMSNFPPALIHRIMLTDPANFPNLTSSGIPRDEHTPTFHEFAIEHGFLPSSPTSIPPTHNSTITTTTHHQQQQQQQISQTIRQAYHDTLQHQILTTQSYQPLTPTLIEVHTLLRSLIPNRTDLHGILSDDGFDTSSTGGFVGHLRKAAECLASLESEDRSLTTREWLLLLIPLESAVEFGGGEGGWKQTVSHPISIGTNDGGEGTTATLSSLQFAIASTLYLHTKAGTCRQEVLDFRLGHLLAPRIHAFGKEYLRYLFQNKFTIGGDGDGDGSLDGCGTSTTPPTDATAIATALPNTKTWVKEMVDQSTHSTEELLISEETRAETLLITGWVDNILFRNPRSVDAEPNPTPTTEEPINNTDTVVTTEVEEEETPITPFLIPEVLSMDLHSISQIRTITKLSVVGSALALHASALSGVGDSVLRGSSGVVVDGKVEECRGRLVQAMAERGVGTREVYEAEVGRVVVDLAKVWNASLTTDTEESIKNRTSAVLRGEDPVLKLLDNRMRSVFRSMMLWNPQTQVVPVRLKTGRTLTLSSVTGGGQQQQGSSASEDYTYDALFQNAAKEEFRSKGFAFYATELAEVNLKSCRVINLVLDLYGASILEALVLDECIS